MEWFGRLIIRKEGISLNSGMGLKNGLGDLRKCVSTSTPNSFNVNLNRKANQRPLVAQGLAFCIGRAGPVDSKDKCICVCCIGPVHVYMVSR